MVTKIETLTYGILNNVDESILKLNSLIKDEGYEFLAISLHDLELQFSEVFGISRHFKPEQSIVKSLTQTDDGQLNTVSEQFDEAIKQYFTLNQYSNEALMLPPDHEVYLIKKIKSSITEQGDSYILIGEAATAENELANFTRNLIRKLRLFKSGQIDFQGYFSIFKEERKVIRPHKTSNRPIYSSNKYTISNEELIDLEKLLNQTLQIPEWLKLSIESFESAYEMADIKVRYILLMIALESIFNKSNREPIRHIISRHTALLLSDSREDFDQIFKQVQTLYDTRCDIVHGKSKTKDLEKLKSKLPEHLAQLENITRQVILKCHWLKDIEDKETFFNYLNKKGFVG